MTAFAPLFTDAELATITERIVSAFEELPVADRHLLDLQGLARSFFLRGGYGNERQYFDTRDQDAVDQIVADVRHRVTFAF